MGRDLKTICWSGWGRAGERGCIACSHAAGSSRIQAWVRVLRGCWGERKAARGLFGLVCGIQTQGGVEVGVAHRQGWRCRGAMPLLCSGRFTAFVLGGWLRSTKAHLGTTTAHPTFPDKPSHPTQTGPSTPTSWPPQSCSRPPKQPSSQRPRQQHSGPTAAGSWPQRRCAQQRPPASGLTKV